MVEGIEGIVKYITRLEAIVAQRAQSDTDFYRLGLGSNFHFFLKIDSNRVLGYFMDNFDYSFSHGDPGDSIKPTSFLHITSEIQLFPDSGPTQVTVYPSVPFGFSKEYLEGETLEYNMAIKAYLKEFSVPLDICRFIRDQRVPYYLPLHTGACRDIYPNGVRPIHRPVVLEF
tara:strand:+ start:430 stop:945 length:516 start_codon:yes stop_codon:yes gene_type:complete